MALLSHLPSGKWWRSSTHERADFSNGLPAQSVAQSLQDPAIHILDIDKKITAALHDSQYPKEMFMAPLAGSLIPLY